MVTEGEMEMYKKVNEACRFMLYLKYNSICKSCPNTGNSDSWSLRHCKRIKKFQMENANITESCTQILQCSIFLHFQPGSFSDWLKNCSHSSCTLPTICYFIGYMFP